VIFQPVLPARGLLFGQMDLNLPTHVTIHPERACTAEWCTHPKNMFASNKKLAMKIAKLYMGTIYNLVATQFSNVHRQIVFIGNHTPMLTLSMT
jgi:hypothetical protein